MELELIAGDIDVNTAKLRAIISYLIKLGLLKKENNKISSPSLNHLKNILFEIRKRDRNRKMENPTKENAPKENGVFHVEQGIFHKESTQSKVKQRKVNKRKSLKEKGEKKNAPILKNKLGEEKNPARGNEKKVGKETEREKTESAPTKEKSFAEKEKIKKESLSACQNIFLAIAPYYLWEPRDSEQLEELLDKIMKTKPMVQTVDELNLSWSSFLSKLPPFWRKKKFTIANLNKNYNEILSEMAAKSNKFSKKTLIVSVQKPVEIPVKTELSEAEREERRKSFLSAIVKAFDGYLQSNDTGFLPLWAMYQTLEEEGHLKMSSAKQKLLWELAVTKRKQDLMHPKNNYETEKFAAKLKDFDKLVQDGEEKDRVKNLAVEEFFEKVKVEKIDLKNLFEL